MQSIRIVAVLLLVALGAPAFAADAGPARSRVDIRVIGEGWGDATPRDIEAVLRSVADVMLEHFPERRLEPILVEYWDKHPLTLFAKGPANEYRMYLSVKDRRWAQFAFEFAHELAHVLTNYEHYASGELTTYNQWFEEALCEVGSLYALKQLSRTWEKSPPYPNWATYAPNFERYLERLLAEPHRELAPDVSLAAWLTRNESDLRGNPHLRSLNEAVASQLLPLFERDPDLWHAIEYLHPHANGADFRTYMQAWRENVPDRYKGAIEYLSAWFGMNDTRTHTAAGERGGDVDRVAAAPVHDVPSGAATTEPRDAAQNSRK
jgi:hypothetical protein